MPVPIALAHPEPHSFQSNAVSGVGTCYADGPRSTSMQEEEAVAESWDYSRMSSRGSYPSTRPSLHCSCSPPHTTPPPSPLLHTPHPLAAAFLLSPSLSAAR
jgi:hypothetical protein